MKAPIFVALILVTALSTFDCQAQDKTFLGVQIGPSFYPYHITDQGNRLKKPFPISDVWGFTIGQKINRYLTLGTGIYRNEYAEGHSFKGISGMDFYSNGITVLQIPLQATGRLNLYKNKIHLTGTLGLHYGINLDYRWDHFPGDSTADGGSGYYKDPNGNSVQYNYVSNDLSKHFLLIETSLGFEFTLFRTAILSIQASKLTGNKKVIRDDIRYTYNNEPEQTGSSYNNGSYLAVMFGVKYPISRIWSKK